MASFEQTVSRNLQCPVCLDLLSEPKQLSCTHTFCQKCLSSLLACFSETNANSLLCPICRSETEVKGGSVKNLNTNVPVKSLIDDVRYSKQLCEMCDTQSRAVHFCCECGKNMCNSCLERHNNWPPNLIHEVVSVEDIREGKAVLKKKVHCKEEVHTADELEVQVQICTDVCTTCKKFICMRCRMLYHTKENGHTVQDAGEYNASIKTEIESLLNQGEAKVTIIKNHITFVESQIERVTNHNDGEKERINNECEESSNKLNERRAALHQQLEAQKDEFCQRLKKMKDADERLVTSIESANVLAKNSLKAPLEGDVIAIRYSLSGELKNLLDRNDPQKELASDVADRAEQQTFTLNNQHDWLSICSHAFSFVALSVFFLVLSLVLFSFFSSPGQVKQNRLEYDLKYGVEFPKEYSMSVMVPTRDGRMAVGYLNGGIGIFSADGQLQRPLLRDVRIRGLAFLSDGRCVVLDGSNTITMYPPEYKNLDVRFDTLSNDEGGHGDLTVDNENQIYVAYIKARKIQVFSAACGKAIREIPCDGYDPMQIFSYDDVLIVQQYENVIIIDKRGNIKHKVSEPSDYRLYAAVTTVHAILIASVNHEEGLLSIDEYSTELKHIKTLISNYKIKKPDRDLYYLQEFPSGDIAFCTPDKLYIFTLSIAFLTGKVDSPLVWSVNQGIRCVELPKKNSMNTMAATSDGMMTVGYSTGGLGIFSVDGQLQRIILREVKILGAGFLSDGRYVILDTRNDITLYTPEYRKLNVRFETLGYDEGGIGSLTVDSHDQIYVGYKQAKKIHVFSPAGGKAISEIPLDGYEPVQIITSYDVLIVKQYYNGIIIIDKKGNIKHELSQSSDYSIYAAVTEDNSVLIVSVRHEEGLVSIDEYTNELTHMKTLISDFKIEKPFRHWYYLQQFKSGEIAFCTPDRLYIFNISTSQVNP